MCAGGGEELLESAGSALGARRASLLLYVDAITADAAGTFSVQLVAARRRLWLPYSLLRVVKHLRVMVIAVAVAMV